jgi:hypothetical protein
MKLRRGTRLASTLLVYFLVTVSGGLPSRWGFVRGDAVAGVTCKDTATSGVQQEKLAAAEERINQYLAESMVTNGDGGKFHVQGWRWHTMSLVREAGRLQKLASTMLASCPAEDLTALRGAAEYVVGFNMKGLHKIEKDLFFPWARRKFTTIGESDVATAFSVVMDQLESDRKTIEQLGTSLVSSFIWIRRDCKFNSSASNEISLFLTHTERCGIGCLGPFLFGTGSIGGHASDVHTVGCDCRIRSFNAPTRRCNFGSWHCSYRSRSGAKVLQQPGDSHAGRL